MRAPLLLCAALLALPLAACSYQPPATAAPVASEIRVAGDAEVRINPERLIVSENPPAPRTVSVTGEAEVKVVPDEVVLTVGVEAINRDLEAAKRQADEIAQRVRGVARSLGVGDKQIQTDYLAIEPRYRDSYEARDFLGYFVRQSIAITLREPDRFEDLLSGVLQAGATYIHGVDFRTTELRKYRDQARALAIKAAREKAEALARELGQQVGAPLHIHEEQSGWYSWYGSWWGGRWGNAATQNVVQNAGGQSWGGEGTIAPGQISVTARVAVEFELQ